MKGKAGTKNKKDGQRNSRRAAKGDYCRRYLSRKGDEKMTIEQIKSWIGDYSAVYITGHVHPDGDCIGAALGLQELLAAHGVAAKIMLESLPDTYSFLPRFAEIKVQAPAEIEVLLVVDCNDPSRFTPFLASYEQAKVVINIDHHELPKQLITAPERCWIKPEASSTSEMIYDLFAQSGTPLTKAAAEDLYTGIIFDTGVFMHSNTQPSTMNAAGKLMEAGIDFGYIMKRLFHRQTLPKLLAKKAALQNFCLLGGGKIGAAFLTNQELTENQLKKDDTEDIVHLLAQLEGTEAAVFLAEFQPGVYKLSFRSRGELDVCEIAKVFGGGGHKKAAGASSELPLAELLTAVEKEISQRL